MPYTTNKNMPAIRKEAAQLALQATLYDQTDNSLKLYQRAIKNYVAQLKK